MMCGRLPLLVAVLFGLWLVAMPGAAHAQAWPCPGGPGADEVQVGETGGGGGVAPTPVCGPRAGAGSSPQQPQIYNRFAAIAWHPNADDVWMIGNHVIAGDAAEKAALEACNAAMGGGCSSVGNWNNSSMSIIRDRHGVLFSGWNGNSGEVRKKVLQDCSAKQPLPCEVIGRFASNKDRYIPDPARARKLFAVAAWVDGLEGYDSKLYVASGYADGFEAERIALAACTKATGRKCKVAEFAANGYLQTYVLGEGDHSVTPESSAKRAVNAAKATCRQKQQKCAMQAAYDSRVRRIFAHDYVTGKAE